MMRPLGIHLAEDRVLGALHAGDGGKRRAHPVLSVMAAHRLQRPRRVGQPQLRGVGEQGDHVIEPAVVDRRGVQVHEVGDGEPVGHVERHGRSPSLRAQWESSSRASAMSRTGGIASTSRSAPSAASFSARAASTRVTRCPSDTSSTAGSRPAA